MNQFVMKNFISAGKIKILALLVSSFFVIEANANTAAAVGISSEKEVVACQQNYFTGSVRVTDQYNPCGIAEDIAMSWANLNCFFAGHSRCRIVSSFVSYVAGNTCEAKASAEPDFSGICRENRSFYRSAWARNYGSIQENCRVADRVAVDAAFYDCRRNFNKCNIKQTAILRYDAATCEVGAVIHGY